MGDLLLSEGPESRGTWGFCLYLTAWRSLWLRITSDSTREQETSVGNDGSEVVVVAEERLHQVS